MLIRLVFPYVYSVLMGVSWSRFFKKKFLNSLAPAFMFHIIIVLLCGMTFGSLSVGVYLGIALAFLLLLYSFFSNKRQDHATGFKELLQQLWGEGLLIYSVFFIFCFFTNYQKRFLSWDEFSHWGMFIKENLRLDSLYCKSPVQFVHKDYVPAITLFETVWCKLCGRFSEADAYRGIQVFMFALLMPVFEPFWEERVSKEKNRMPGYLFRFSPMLIVLLIPLIFNTDNGFMFYHSVYCDVVVGILFFYCAFVVYREDLSSKYTCLILTLGNTVLVLTKMSAVALLPMIMVLFLTQYVVYKDRGNLVRKVLMLLPTGAVPVLFWIWYNRFVDKYVPNIGSTQSYDGMRLSAIADVFADPSKSSIPYIGKIRDHYIDALLHRDILIHGSYIVVIIFCFIAFMIMANTVKEDRDKYRLLIAGTWSLVMGTAYAFLMYFLYATAFCEQEAVYLASYERYMNSFVISIVFFVISAYFDSGIWREHKKDYYVLLLVFSMSLSFMHIDAFDQLLPGNLTKDEEKISEYTVNASTILNNTPEDSIVFLVKRGDDGDYLWHMCYYCSPRTFWGGSIGPAVSESDTWSADYTVEEFTDSVRQSDYICFCEIDDAFMDKYSEVFADPSLISDGKLYRISNNQEGIILENPGP